MKRINKTELFMNCLKKIVICMVLLVIGSFISLLTEMKTKSATNSSSDSKVSAGMEEANSNHITTYLTSQTSSILITKKVKKISIKPIAAYDSNIVLTVQNKNIYNGKYDNGYLVFGKQEVYSPKSKDYKTTKWFPVLAYQGKSLVLSGTAHNRATWQFKTANGNIITEVGSFQKFKEVEDVLQDKTISKIDIPENAVSARVYFISYKDQGADKLDNRLQIEYGKIPTNYEPSYQKKITLPSVRKGSIIYFEDGKWNLTDKKNSTTIDIEPVKLQIGDTLSLKTRTACEIQITWETETDIIKTGSYGVRWSVNDSNPVCERVGDAKGLHFNAVEGSTQLTPYQNDFDNIYPWSDMKVCAVKVLDNGSRSVTYKGEKEFVLDGSSGNIMVEIPKFYCKREVIGKYEYLWISPNKQEGYIVDPSFVTSDGEIDHIYVGAYLSSIKDNRLVSISHSFPLIKLSLDKLQKLVENSNGFTECDLLSIMTVQRLYLVETAVLDSQSVFSGNVNMPYLLKDKTTSYYAIKSEKQTNSIFVNKTNMTLKFHIGDAVSVLSSWNEYDNSKDFHREITDIKDMGNQSLRITFSGEPLDITKKYTGITCIPSKNGETNQLPGVTGAVTSDSGQSSFKYRGIENLWGNVSILLDGAYVKNSKLYINYPDNRTVKVDYTLPVQNVQLSAKQFGDPSNMMVKRMGYDKNNPLIMFPSEIGNGALTSSYYCDSWYNLAKKDVTYILTYGGAWDNKGYAGVFNLRATFTKKDAIPFNGSRLMLR